MKKLFSAAALVILCAATFAADDPVKVDNEFVRIVKVADAPHNKTALHRHQFNRVMVYLDAGDIDINYEDGHIDHQHWKAGEVAWSPAGGMHTSENVGSAPIRIVEMELKKASPMVALQRKPELDPVALDPAHNVVLLENDQVRVIRSWREPGTTEIVHEHLGVGRAVVFLTDLDASVKLGDGNTTRLHNSAGDVLWAGGMVKHAATNTGANKYEIILVEVK
jgi:uncharacterized RmlC-like cupin family protein